MIHSLPSNHSVRPSAWSANGLDWSSLSLQNGASGSSLFSSLLASISNNGALPASQQNTSDILSQLAALVQNGTPLSSIAGQISQRVANALQHRLGASLSQSDLDRIRSSITEQIGKALAPPGNAPPGTARQQVQALAIRLQRLIETIARGTTTTGSGQQNEISGNLLDAKSAKDIPAQSGTKQASNDIDVSSLVRSLLSGALANLAVQPKLAVPVKGEGGAKPLKSLGQPAAPTTLGNPSPGPAASAQSPVAPNTPSSSLAQAQSSPAAQPSQGQITMENAPDLLARMLVRAAGTDAKINGNAVVSGASNGAQSTSAQTPSALAARFEAAISALVNAASSSGPNGSPSSRQDGGSSFDQNLSAQPGSAPHDLSSPASTAVAAASPSFASHVTFAQSAQSPLPALDTTAVIEQVLKGMTMRTNAQGNSEIRLHLQPENLGDVTMRITVTGSQISATAVASNADVRNALLSNHHQLAQSLAEAGLTLSGFSVDVSGGDAGRDNNRDRTSGFGRRYTVHELRGAAPAETPSLSTLAPVSTGSSLELFNYLA